MGLGICFVDDVEGKTGTYSLASASGWNLVYQWVETLPQDKYPLLRRLTNDGHAPNTAALSEEITNVLEEFHEALPFPQEHVRHTLEGLLEKIDGGDEGEDAVVVNESDDEDEDEEHGSDLEDPDDDGDNEDDEDENRNEELEDYYDEFNPTTNKESGEPLVDGLWVTLEGGQHVYISGGHIYLRPPTKGGDPGRKMFPEVDDDEEEESP